MPLRRLLSPTCVAFLILFFLSASAVGENIQQIKAQGYVTDLAGVLSQGARQDLESLCTKLERKTGAQMAIVTVRSLEGESIETYAVDLYQHLGVGGKQDNRGVLLLVAPPERKYRIEVGYGLEPVINDARAGDAGRAMVPFLRRGDYDGALKTAAWQLAQYVAADRGVTLIERSSPQPVREPRQSDNGFPFWVILVVAWLVFTALRSAFRSAGGSRGRSGASFPWWIFLLGGGGRRGNGWGGGGWGGGSFGGGGGFGGFGGGMSGGGGASGSW